jgi:actin-like ATPase involved in cell morphogenesis
LNNIKAVSRRNTAGINCPTSWIEELLMAGGGALLRGFDKLIEEETGMPVTVTDDPLTAVVRGTGIVLEDINSLKDVLVLTEFEQIPR